MASAFEQAIVCIGVKQPFPLKTVYYLPLTRLQEESGREEGFLKGLRM